jgi:hypothetical protein
MVKYPFIPLSYGYNKDIEHDIALAVTNNNQLVKWMAILNTLTETELSVVLFPHKHRVRPYRALRSVRYGIGPKLEGEFAFRLFSMLLAKNYIDLLIAVLVFKKYVVHDARILATTILSKDIGESKLLNIHYTPIFRNMEISPILIQHAIDKRYHSLYLELLKKHPAGYLTRSSIAATLDTFLKYKPHENTCKTLLKSSELTNNNIITILNYAIDSKFYNTVENIIKQFMRQNNYDTLKEVYSKVPKDPAILKLFQTHDKCYISPEINVEYQEEGAT